MRARRLAIASCALGLSALLSAQQVESSEELARRFLASGLKFLREGRPGEGLKDLQRVVESYPSSSVADDALIEIAQYHLAAGADLGAARAAVDALLTKYPMADTAPLAYVVSGRIGVAQARGPDDLERALADFERVPTLFPRSPEVAAALTHAGDTLRQLDRLDAAVRAYEQVALEYPRSSWASRALLGLASARVAGGKPLLALEALSRIQSRAPGTREAAQATSWATILYRLYLRASSAPAFVASDRVLAGAGGRLEDVVAVHVTAEGEVLALQRDGLLRFTRDGAVRHAQRAVEARALIIGPEDAVAILSRSAIQLPERPPIPLSTQRPDGGLRPIDDARAGVWGRGGHYLVADGGARNIVRVAPDGKPAGAFASLDAVRMAASDSGRVAAIERGGKVVLVLDATGRQVGRVGPSGQGFALREPADVAWDALGHLYVLDRGQGSVFVFAPALQLVTSFAPPERAPGEFRRAEAFDVDAQGRLYVYDARARSIRLYQ